MKLHSILVISAITLGLGGVSRADDAAAGASQTSPKVERSDVLLSQLMQANVASKSGENLGQIKDFMISPRTGRIDYAVMGGDSGPGTAGTLVPVPWKAVQVTSQKQFTLNLDKEKLKSAPTADSQLSQLNQPDYTVTIYRFYEIPDETGAAQSPGGTEQGSGNNSSPGKGNRDQNSQGQGGSQ